MSNRRKHLEENGNSDIDIESIFKSLEPLLKKTAANGQVLKAKIINTPIGTLVAISDDDKLLMLTFSDSKGLERNIKRIIKMEHVRAIVVDDGNTKPLISVEYELEQYFYGHLTAFKTPVQINADETDYQKSVLLQIASIPYGETSTYSKLANNLNKPKSFRAVANACGRNMICVVIPCHRVLSTGGLGGFTCGVDRKVWLLDHEKGVKTGE